MGLSVSPDIFQEKMSELMAGFDFAHAYLDDLLIISTEKSFDKHDRIFTGIGCPGVMTILSHELVV
jgi:hypothetical protein